MKKTILPPNVSSLSLGLDGITSSSALWSSSHSQGPWCDFECLLQKKRERAKVLLSRAKNRFGRRLGGNHRQSERRQRCGSEWIWRGRIQSKGSARKGLGSRWWAILSTFWEIKIRDSVLYHSTELSKAQIQNECKCYPFRWQMLCPHWKELCEQLLGIPGLFSQVNEFRLIGIPRNGEEGSPQNLLLPLWTRLMSGLFPRSRGSCPSLPNDTKKKNWKLSLLGA